MVIISTSFSPKRTICGKGNLQISHSNLVKLYDAAIPLSYFFTLLFIHVRRQPTWIKRQVPLHLHGEMRGSPSVYSLQRQTLQLFSPASTASSWADLFLAI